MAEPKRKTASATGVPGTAGQSHDLLSVAELEEAAANYESASRTYRQVLDQSPTPAQRARACGASGPVRRSLDVGRMHS